MAEAPRVFFSYSHDSVEHKDRVLALCDRLRRDGLDAWIDQYELSPPEGWLRWMERQIEKADFVLVVCTESYLRRFRGLEEPGRGLGANWEGAVITQELYNAALRNTKFIPVIFSPQDGEHVPIVLQGVTRYRADHDEGYEALYRHLTGQPEVPPSELGPLKKLPPRPRPTLPARKRKPTVLIGLLLVVATLAALAAAQKFKTGLEEAGEPTREEIPGLRVLQGEILDEQTRKPLAGVRVHLPEHDQEMDTDENGQYRFELAVPPYTRVRLRATLEGYEPLRQDPSVDHNNVYGMRRKP